jgi:predicted MFS family arabinose efflux permease
MISVRIAQGEHAGPPTIVWRAVLSAFCASLIGIGLARFAYTPLLPAIINDRWFEPAAAAYLGAANLAGYLVGALSGRPLSARVPLVVVLRAMMLLATAAFFACAYPVGFAWFFVWRFVAGAAGGALMVLAAPNVLPHVPASQRGLAGGAIFMGVGAGVAISGTLVPLLLAQGLRETWLGLGAVSLLLTLVGWSGWPSASAPAANSSAQPHGPKLWTLRALYAEYGLNAAGWVPHMVFLVDFIARGQGEGIRTGSEYWVIFALGATVGPWWLGISPIAQASRLLFVWPSCFRSSRWRSPRSDWAGSGLSARALWLAPS